MTRRFSSISTQTTLATSISNTALSCVVATGTAATLLGGVALTAGNVDQFKIIFDPDTASAEICYITEVTSDTLTIQRGKDGTSAVSHTGGAVIKHVLTGEDLTYFTTGVVPTSDLATGLPFPGSTSGTATLKAPAVAGTSTITMPGATGTLATLAGTETLTNKTLTSPTINTLVLPLLTTAGDIIYASATSTPARLGIGSSAQVLTVAGGVPSWATPASGTTFVGCSLKSTATNIVVATGTWTAIAWDAEYQDTSALHDNVTNNSRITIPSGKDGMYEFTLNLLSAPAATYFRAALYKNGVVARYWQEDDTRTSGYRRNIFTYLIDAVATDYFEVFVFQSSGGNLNYHGDGLAAGISNFSAKYLGA